MTGLVGLSGMTTLLNACTKKTNESANDDDEDGDPGVNTGGVPLLATHWVSASATGSGNGTQQNPYMIAAIDLQNLNGNGTSAACHMGAYSNDNVVVGIRPLT